MREGWTFPKDARAGQALPFQSQGFSDHLVLAYLGYFRQIEGEESVGISLIFKDFVQKEHS